MSNLIGFHTSPPKALYSGYLIIVTIISVVNMRDIPAIRTDSKLVNKRPVNETLCTLTHEIQSLVDRIEQVGYVVDIFNVVLAFGYQNLPEGKVNYGDKNPKMGRVFIEVPPLPENRFSKSLDHIPLMHEPPKNLPPSSRFPYSDKTKIGEISDCIYGLKTPYIETPKTKQFMEDTERVLDGMGLKRTHIIDNSLDQED